MDETTLCINCFKTIDPTIGGGEICPHCGFNNLTQNIENTLSPKTKLHDRYLVGAVHLGNAEGFTYAGFDTEQNQVVVIREFFPTTLAYREGTEIHSGENTKILFHQLYLDFVNLANSLIKINNISGIIPAIDIFSENNTCYIVYKKYESVSLKSHIEKNGGSISYNDIQTLFTPMINSLSTMHSMGIKHLGISTQTLRVCSDGKLRLAEFSIEALRSFGSGIDPDLKVNCVAYEQYTQKLPHLEYSDVYGFASCILYALSGQLPKPVKERLSNPRLLLSKEIVNNTPKHALVALASALQVKPSLRTSSFESFKADFLGETKSIKKEDDSKVVEEIPTNTVHKKRLGSHPVIWLLMSFAVSILIFYFIFTSYTDNKKISLNSIISYFESHMETDITNNITVPDMTGGYFIDWQEKVNSNAGYKFELVPEYTFDAIVPEGKIISHAPEGGGSVATDGEITVQVSMGSKTRELPDVIGMYFDDAVELLEKEGLVPLKEYAKDKNAKEDTVLYYGNDYAPGDTIDHGESVTLVVNSKN